MLIKTRLCINASFLATILTISFINDLKADLLNKDSLKEFVKEGDKEIKLSFIKDKKSGKNYLQARSLKKSLCSISLKKRIILPKGRNCSVSCELRIFTMRGKTGNAGIKVYSDDDKLLGQAVYKAPSKKINLWAGRSEKDRWMKMSINISGGLSESPVKIALFAGGNVWRCAFRNLKVDDVVLPVPPKHIIWGNAENNIVLQPGDSLEVKGSLPDKLAASARKILQKSLGKKNKLVDKNGTFELSVEFDPDQQKWPEKEKYTLKIGSGQIILKAFGGTGAFNGIMTIADLMMVDTKGNLTLPACEITDWPSMRFRGVHFGGAGIRCDFHGEREKNLIRLARLKCNYWLYEFGMPWYDLVNNKKERKFIIETQRHMAAYGISLVPVMVGLGHCAPILKKHPNWIEGSPVVAEKLLFKGEEPVKLENPNIIRNNSTDIVLSLTSDMSNPFQLGRDYEIIGKIKSYADLKKKISFQVKRTKNSRIPLNIPVYAAYDCVKKGDLKNGGSYCLSQIGLRQFMFLHLKAVAELLKPDYFCIAHDEPTKVCADNRCIRYLKKMNKNPAELVARDITNCYQAIKAGSAQTRVIMWDDTINTIRYKKIVGSHITPIIEMIPADVIAACWNYWGADHAWECRRDKAIKSFANISKTGAFMAGKKRLFIGCAWYRKDNIKEWAKTVSRYPEYGLGMIGTTWGTKDGHAPALRAAWMGSQ